MPTRRSPQARGEAGDARSDVYATAILLHELLTGARSIATEGRDDLLVRRDIAAGSARVSLTPEAAHLAPVLTRALAADPAARYADAARMREALRAATSVVRPTSARMERADSASEIA